LTVPTHEDVVEPGIREQLFRNLSPNFKEGKNDLFKIPNDDSSNHEDGMFSSGVETKKRQMIIKDKYKSVHIDMNETVLENMNKVH